MKLAFSSNAFLNYPFSEAARRIAEAGYLGLELLADVPHAWPVRLLDDQKQAIRLALAQYGLGLANINAFMMNAIADRRQPYWHPSWIEPDEHYRRVRVDHTIRALHLAKELGSPSISTEPGGPLPHGWSWQQGLSRFVAELAPVAAIADKVQVYLLIEPEPGLLIERSDQFEELMDRLRNFQFVGLNFDIGHFYCVGEDPAAVARTLAPYIRHVHLEDIATTRLHHHLIPGEGGIDFARVLASLQQNGYHGWVTVELYPYVEDPDTAARRALAYLSRLAQDHSLPLEMRP
ncbi:MAG: sugar phosphate isomerase [Gemmataceae bacterium]